jgi:hypothetical protein
MKQSPLICIFGQICVHKKSDPRLQKIYLRDLTSLLLGFFGILRRSELIKTKKFSEVTCCHHMEIFIRRSTTDRAGLGTWSQSLPAPMTGQGSETEFENKPS